MAERPLAGPAPRVSGRLRCTPEDFIVREQLGFVPDGDGEHAFLHLEKRGLNTPDLAQRLSELSGVPLRDIGFSGLKDRQAVTSQWFSLGLAGRAEPDWRRLEVRGDVRVLEVSRHRRKLRRGVHRGNLFSLVLRDVQGDLESLVMALEQLQRCGAPNYFAEQRFGRDGSNLVRARAWVAGGGRRVTRQRRGIQLSALRADLFNRILAGRVRAGTWDRILDGDLCVLQGSRSQFQCAQVDADLQRRAEQGDVHPALPLWGRGASRQGGARGAEQALWLSGHEDICRFLEAAGLDLDYRPARCLLDDFSWKFCDDDALGLSFSLGVGSYATAVLAQIIDYQEGDNPGGDGSE